MRRTCPECQRGRLELIGLGDYEDTIFVECPECGAELELEPDGLGEGGLEMAEAFEVEQKRRQEEDAQEFAEAAPTTVHSLVIPAGVTTYWSARAIYSWSEGSPVVDILPDRQSMAGHEDEAAAKRLTNWLNTEGLAGIRDVCLRENLQPNEARAVSYSSGRFKISGTPNGSYGYLYIVTYEEPQS